MRIKIFWDSDAAWGMGVPVCRDIGRVLNLEGEIQENPLMLTGFNRHRGQFDAQKILQRLEFFRRMHGIGELILLVTGKDLYVKGADFVYGLAREDFGVAVVSTARMTNEYYGREEDLGDLRRRIVTEGAHEIGHLLGLPHCTDISCLMFPPETRDQLDRKKVHLCTGCRRMLDGNAETGAHPDSI